MRIALLGPAPPFRGGITQFALMLAREYRSQGHEVAMFTFTSQYPKLLFPGGEQTTEFADLPEVEVERIFTPYLPWTWNKAAKKIADWKPDVVIVSYFLPWFAPSYGWICRKLKNTRIVYLAHNIDFHEKWPGADLMSRWAFEPARRIAVLSRSCLDDLKRKMPNRIAVRGVLGFHPLYDYYAGEGDPYPEQKAAGPTVLFFGLIKPYKGLDVLIKALALARREIPELKLLVAGEVYGPVEPYQKLIRELGIADAVEAHYRYVPDIEISSFFRRSQVCVLPYKSATQSGVIATAYSFNLPVIASNVGGLSEYIEPRETGLLAAPDDETALAECLARYFREGLFDQFSRKIPAYKSRFSWNKLAELLVRE